MSNMADANNVLHGTIQGKTIVLDTETGLPAGQEVFVILAPVNQGTTKLPPGEGIRRSAGAWADDADELDEYLKWNRAARKSDRSMVED
jgi:hypothetical protein